MEQMKQTLADLKTRFFTLEEFPFIQRESLPMDVGTRIQKWPERDLRPLAMSLTGKELEGLLLDIRDAEDSGFIRRGAEILEIRLTGRIMKLLTILYQYHDHSVGLQFALKRIHRVLKERQDTFSQAAFIKTFGGHEDKMARVCTAIEESGMDIDTCFQIFQIYSASPFAKEGVFRYLSQGSKEALMINRRWITSTIEDHEPDQIYELVSNYLSAFALIEFHDGINLSILRKIGRPYVSTDWEPYERDLQDKFVQWSFLYQLKIHSMGFPRKYAVLSKYFGQVRTSWQDREERLMVMDFGDVVVADMANHPDSFFYEKEEFEKEMKAWKGDEPQLPTFLRNDRKNMTARDFMIEEKEEPCVQLSYEGVDVLYIQEILDIKMGLEPDMRRTQLAKLRRKKARR